MEKHNEETVNEENFEEMSQPKTMLWRIISMVIFAVLIWVAVASVDFIADIIKGLISRF